MKAGSRDDVILKLPAKDDWDSWLRHETRSQLQRRMLLVLNKDFHSPLTLAAEKLDAVQGQELDEVTAAAVNKKVDMLAFLLNELKEVVWTYGPVKCSLVSLEGLEFPYDYNEYPELAKKVNKTAESEKTKSWWRWLREGPKSKKPPLYGVLDWICMRNSTKAIQLMDIRKIVETKWERVGQRNFVKMLYLHIVVVLGFTILSIFPYVYPTTLFHNAAHGDKVATIIYPILAAILLYKFAFDIINLRKYGGSYFDGVRGAAKLEKYLRLSIMVCFAAICCLKIALHHYSPGYTTSWEDSLPVFEERILSATSLFTSCGTFVTWVYLFYFLMVRRFSIR